jgi:hypothetical protein
VVTGAHGLLVWVIGQHYASCTQPVNHGRGAVRAGQLSQRPVVGILPGITGEEDGQGSQVRQNLILANVGVLRPGQIGDRGAGVTVPAPVRGPAVGPA